MHPVSNVGVACYDVAIETTDDGIKNEKLIFQWDLISGPLQGVTGGHDSWTKPLLTLQHLKIGIYVLK